MICCSVSGVGKVVGIENDLNNIEFLKVEVERPFLDRYQNKIIDIIPIYDWKNDCKRFSGFINENDLIAFKGRIETREEIGVIIVSEQLSVILKVKK